MARERLGIVPGDHRHVTLDAQSADLLNGFQRFRGIGLQAGDSQRVGQALLVMSAKVEVVVVVSNPLQLGRRRLDSSPS